jgi:hypothetical protein
MSGQAQVVQHHARAQQQRCGVCFVLASDVWGCAMHLHAYNHDSRNHDNNNINNKTTTKQQNSNNNDRNSNTLHCTS